MAKALYVSDYVWNVIWCEDGPKDPQNRVTSHTLRSVLTAVAKRTNYNNGESAYPTQDTIVKDSGVSRASVNRALAVLIELGWLEKVGEAPNRSRGVTYKLLIPEALQKSHSETSHGETSHHETNECLTTRQTNVSPRDTIRSLDQNPDQTQREPAAATHAREPAYTHEGQPAAAPSSEALKAEDKGRQAAAGEPSLKAATPEQGKAPSKPTAEPVAVSEDEPSDELVTWLGTTIKARVGQLVRSPGEVKPSQIRPGLRSLKRWAAGDEARVKSYLADELDRQETRDADERAGSVSVLARWLADRKAWERWQAVADVQPAATGSAPARERDPSIPIGKPPRPGMVWHPKLGRWAQSNEQHSGIGHTLRPEILALYGVPPKTSGEV